MAFSFQVYVDSVFGNDNTGELQNNIHPFKSIQAAINKINQPVTGTRWMVLISPGFYDESVTLPGNIDLQGYRLDVTITSLTITGDSHVFQINVYNHDSPALVINIPPANGTADLLLVNLVTTYTSTPDSPPLGVDLISGRALLTRCGNFTVVKSPVTSAYLYRSAGELIVQNCQDELDISGTADVVYMYYSVNSTSKIQLSGGISKLTTNSSSKVNALLAGRDAQLFVVHHRLAMIQSDNCQLNENIIVYAKGSTVADITNTQFQFTGHEPGTLLSAYGVSNDEGNKPTVRILDCAYLANYFGPVLGDFQEKSWGVIIKDGSFITTGTISDQLRHITDNYHIESYDRSLIVHSERITLRLPDPSNILPKGQDLFIKNESSGPIRIRGKLPRGKIILPAGQSLFLKNDSDRWYVIL